MKTINGKLAAAVVAVTIGMAGAFVPSTARASPENLNNFIDGNSPSNNVVGQGFLFGGPLAGLANILSGHDMWGPIGISMANMLWETHKADDRFVPDKRSDASWSFGRGMAAGGLFGLGDDASVWASGSHNSAENDFAATAFESDTKSASFGGDVRLDEIATLGAFLSLSDTESSTSFNGGGSETNTVSFGPYVSAVVNENVFVDASFGFLFMESDNRRTPVGGGTVITGGQGGTGMFGAANLNYSRWLENVNLNGRVGVTAANVRNESYTDSTGVAIAGFGSETVQLQLEAQASYFFDNFAPFVRFGYNVEASPDIATAPGTPQPANDKDEFTVGGGVNLFGFGPVSGGINYSRTLARSEFSSWTVVGQISVALGGG